MSMDSSEDHSKTTTTKERSLSFVALRWSLVLLIPVVAFFALSFLVGLVAVLLASSSVTSPISVHSQCKIVSTSVDIRSSKVCELGLFNYKAKHVFYPLEKSKFRCRYDYYWASVFKVEYKDVTSGDVRLALAEAPTEALPMNCRPNFGAAWLNKDKFKVNETYECWYSYGIPKVSLNQDGLFDCQANDPSSFEMIKRYFILTVKMLKSWLWSGKWWEMWAGVMAGFSTSLITITSIAILQHIKSSLPRLSLGRLCRKVALKVTIARACFLFVYFSAMCWLFFQYSKRLGLTEIFTVFYG